MSEILYIQLQAIFFRWQQFDFQTSFKTKMIRTKHMLFSDVLYKKGFDYVFCAKKDNPEVPVSTKAKGLSPFIVSTVEVKHKLCYTKKYDICEL